MRIVQQINDFKDVICDKLDDVKNLFSPNNNKLDIKNFVKQVLKKFKAKVNDSSTDQVIQFPMVFDIRLCQEDYKNLKQLIPGQFDAILKGFYKIVYEKLKDYPHAEVKNINRYWMFTISESDGIDKGKVDIKTDLYGSDIRTADMGALENVDGSDETLASSNGELGSIAGTAFNLDVLNGGKRHKNGQYTYDFDINRIYNKGNQSKNERRALAALTWKSDKSKMKSSRPFLMQENSVFISNSRDTRFNPTGIMKVDDDLVEQDHIQIKYVESEEEFEMCAFADEVRLNQILVPQSKGQNYIWKTMPKKSTIIIRNSLIIKFVAL